MCHREFVFQVSKQISLSLDRTRVAISPVSSHYVELTGCWLHSYREVSILSSKSRLNY